MSFEEKRLLNEIIKRLSADSRIAEVVVTSVAADPQTGKTKTTLKFLEYDAQQNPLPPKYFTFSDNIIQFQSLVIRFDDFFVKKADPFKGKSAYLFMKVFSLNKDAPEIYDINKINEVPSGYIISGRSLYLQRLFWKRFWVYALNWDEAKRAGIKNAQIEAPGTRFIPGLLYTIKIEHDGGIRIDSKPLPEILKGQNLGF